LAATGEDEPGILQGTAEVPHPIAAAPLPEAASVFDTATALDTAMDMVDPQPPLVELLVSHVLLPREFLPQIGINSIVQTGVLSILGEAVLQRHGMTYTYEQLVDRIHCQTEELLATVEDPKEAYQLVKARARR